VGGALTAGDFCSPSRQAVRGDALSRSTVFSARTGRRQQGIISRAELSFPSGTELFESPPQISEIGGTRIRYSSTT